MHTMTASKHKAERIDLKALAGNDREFLRQLIRTTLQEVLEAEMTEALAAAKSERTVGRRALVSALAEMYVQGVSTRKVKAITEELCGHSFSATTISEATARLDEKLKAFFGRRLDEPYPYLIVDARYERVREGGVIASQAVLVAIGVDWEGRRQVLGVEVANRESRSSWREFMAGLRARGLHGVEYVVSDDHAGLKAA